MPSDKNKIVYPSADDLDTGGWEPNSGVKLFVYLEPASDGEPARIWADQTHGSGTPFAAHHRRVWGLFSLGQDVVGGTVLNFLRAHEDEILALAACFEGEEYDGKNIVGKWSDDAAEPFPYGVDTVDEGIGHYWSAGDWLNAEDLVTGEETPAVLDALAARLVAEGVAQGAYLREDDVRAALFDAAAAARDAEDEIRALAEGEDYTEDELRAPAEDENYA